MRSTLILFVLFAPLTSFCQKGYVVSCEVKGAKDSTKVYLNKNTISDIDGIDSTYILNQRFIFKGSVDNPVECNIDIQDENDEENFYSKTFWLENATIRINGTLQDFSNATVKGSVSNLSYEKYVTEVIQHRERLNGYYYDTTSAELTERFIRKYPDSYKSLQELYLFRQVFPITLVSTLYANMSNTMKESRSGKHLDTFLHSYQILKVGDEAPEFTFIDTHGERRSLRYFRGKYVLLIFWGSWCGPCRANNAKYNEIYNVHDSSKLAILGIALDRKENFLQAAIEDKIKWRNMILPGDYDSPLLYRYGIWSVPDNMLIDTDGKIVARDLLVDKLAEVNMQSLLTKLKLLKSN